MGIFDEQIKLPGVITQIEADYSYGFDPASFGTTDSVVIIGTAFNGPVGVPTPIYSVEHALYIFGDAYDPESRKEASLVAGVQDAWDRGCRTIYCVRVGGKEMYKDFDFAYDSPYRLRVSSQFPTNIGKECYFLYEGKDGAEAITLYKPAERATIVEKRRGLVSNAQSMLKSTLRLSQDYRITKQDRLVDVINIFNTNIYNNVLKMSIVNSAGVDVTSSPDVYGLTVEHLFPGVYFIGRDESACEERTELSFHLDMKSKTDDPRVKKEDIYYRVLELNTDIGKPYPIYTNEHNQKDFYEIMHERDIVVKDWEFLEVPGITDRAFYPDLIDYEETKLSNFELYKRLGSGFAITARAEKRLTTDQKETTPRISETPISDKNRIQPIMEGIYSVLEDAEIKYRVLVCANAEEKINGRLPRPDDFKKAIPNPFGVMEGGQSPSKYTHIKFTPVLDEKCFSDPKKYKIQFQLAEKTAIDDVKEVYTDEIFPVIAKIDSTAAADKDKLEEALSKGHYDRGQYVFLEADQKIYRLNLDGVKAIESEGYVNKHYIIDNEVYKGVGTKGNITFEKVSDLSSMIDSKKYVLGSTLNTVFMYDASAATLVPLGDFKSILNSAGEESTVVVYATSLPAKENEIILRSSLWENITLEELVDIINMHPVLKFLFKAELTQEGSEMKDEIITDLLKDLKDKAIHDVGKTVEDAGDRNITYDYNMYIPYRTNDNFARQLAQHCTYTELKTIPTYGVIGCKRLVNTGLTSVAEKVKELVSTDFDLYAKTNYGRRMLDRQNLPYNIGKNLSLVFGQYPVVMSNNKYTYVSNGAAGYAGMVSNLPLDQSSTAQPINLPGVDFTCSQNQLSQLTAAGIVTFRRSFTKGLVVTDGVTMAMGDSIFRRLSASRITGAVEDLIRRACEPFIGKQNHVANRNALKTAIRSNLDKVVGTLLEAYDFTMNNDPGIMKYSYIEIYYEIVPIYEIREIRNTIKVTNALSHTLNSNK